MKKIVCFARTPEDMTEDRIKRTVMENQMIMFKFIKGYIPMDRRTLFFCAPLTRCLFKAMSLTIKADLADTTEKKIINALLSVYKHLLISKDTLKSSENYSFVRFSI